MQFGHPLPHRLSAQGRVIGDGELYGQPQKLLGRLHLPFLLALARLALRVEDVSFGGGRTEEIIVVGKVSKPVVVASAIRVPPWLFLLPIIL